MSIATEQREPAQPQLTIQGSQPAIETKAVVPTASETKTQDNLLKFGGKEYKDANELGKAYEAAQTELGKWTQQHGDLKKQYDETNQKATRWEDWWKSVGPLWGNDVEDFLRRKLTQGQGRQPETAQSQQAAQQQIAQQQQQVAQQLAENYDFFKPEDVQRFRQNLAREMQTSMQGSLQQQLTQAMQNMGQQIAQKEQWYQTYLTNHLSLLRRAFEEKMKNPEFNIEKVMQGAAQAIGGQIDPIELGKNLLTAAEFEARMESAKKGAYEQGRKDFEQEAVNKKQEAVPAVNVQVPKYTVPTTPNGTRRGLHTLRETAAQNILQKFGPAWLTGQG